MEKQELTGSVPGNIQYIFKRMIIFQKLCEFVFNQTKLTSEEPNCFKVSNFHSRIILFRKNIFLKIYQHKVKMEYRHEYLHIGLFFYLKLIFSKCFVYD